MSLIGNETEVKEVTDHLAVESVSKRARYI